MAPNSSSTSNSSLSIWTVCFFYSSGSSIYVSFSVTNTLLLLPLCTLVLHHGLQQWRRSRSVSLLDVFTHNMVVVELIGLVGCNLACVAIFTKNLSLLYTAMPIYSYGWFGQNFFHELNNTFLQNFFLTCVERYLAVVHPVTYLKLRNKIWIKMVAVASVDLLCGVIVSLSQVENIFLIVNLPLSIGSLVTVSFCSLAVLRVLIGPGPGEQGGKRQRVDQSKRRAFYTIMVILGVLGIRLAGGVVWNVLPVYGEVNDCTILFSQVWLNLPSSLVLPLLFLHRERK